MPVKRRWFAEDGDISWDLYFETDFDKPSPIEGFSQSMFMHPHKVIKAPKIGSTHAEYWPTLDDSAFIVKALNAAENVDDRVGAILRELIKDLTDRRGLRQEWEGIDDEARTEIIDTWRGLIRKVLEAP